MRPAHWLAALGLTVCGGLTAALASELTGTPARPNDRTPPAGSTPAPAPAVPPKAEGECGNHGTSVEFLDSPREAAAQAKKEQKLVFVLHVSGHFESPEFT
jgi:hypothetical protein